MGDAVYRDIRHLERARHLHPAVPGRAAGCAEGALRGRGGGRRVVVAQVPVSNCPRRPAGDHAGHLAGRYYRREPVHRAVPADRRRRPERQVHLAGAADLRNRHRAEPPRLRLGPRGHPRHRGLRNRRHPATRAKETGVTQTVSGASEVSAAPAAGSGDIPAIEPRVPRSWWRLIVLLLGALVFLFPFYYMIIGSLQQTANTSLSGVIPWPANLTLHNYSQINAALSLGKALLNSA